MSQPITTVRDGPLALGYPCRFTIAGVEYDSLEHYLIVNFCEHIALTRPADLPRLGETTADCDPSVWDDAARGLLADAALARFSQDDAARATLLATRGTQLAVHGVADPVFGTGLDAGHPDADFPDRWPGRNWLGAVLGELRDRLLSREADEPPARVAPAGERELVVWEANAPDWQAFAALALRRGWLRVLHVSDEPARPAFLEQAAHADLVLATGDLDDRIEQSPCPVFYVFGNHDRPEELASRFLARPEAVLHGCSVVWQGLRLGGVGGCLPYKADPTGQVTEREYEKALAGRGPLDVFLSHVPPPFAAKDDGVHECPMAVADYLLRRPPWLHLFGHTHQNLVARVGPTTHVGTRGSRWLGIGPPAA